MEGKKERVRQMFNSIAPSYDLLNHTLSLSIDKRWRQRVIRAVANSGATEILDVATGTGDLAIGIARAVRGHITGVDLSPAMLEVARAKVSSRGLTDRITLEVQDVEQMSFAEASFDAVTCAFGVRNFENLELGLRQMWRVLRSDGEIHILEFSHTGRGLWGKIYGFYFHHILPLVGRIVSGDRAAYKYLPQSVDQFVSGDDFLDILSRVGFSQCAARQLMGGIATIYSAKR